MKLSRRTFFFCPVFSDEGKCRNSNQGPPTRREIVFCCIRRSCLATWEFGPAETSRGRHHRTCAPSGRPNAPRRVARPASAIDAACADRAPATTVHSRAPRGSPPWRAAPLFLCRQFPTTAPLAASSADWAPHATSRRRRAWAWAASGQQHHLPQSRCSRHLRCARFYRVSALARACVSSLQARSTSLRVLPPRGPASALRSCALTSSSDRAVACFSFRRPCAAIRRSYSTLSPPCRRASCVPWTQPHERRAVAPKRSS